jgi:hypothetical protein
MTDFEARKTIWATIGRLFVCDEVTIWIFSADDMIEANRLPDGSGSRLYYCGVAHGIEP